MAKDGKKKKTSAEHSAVAEEALKPQKARLQQRFEGEVRPKITEAFGIKNPMAMPQLEKVTINVNIGRHLDGTKVPAQVRETVVDTLTQITGQKPVRILAKKSVSNFKVREGYETAYAVTLRRERMWFFVDRLFNLAAPRIKDFRGVKTTAFDRQGNYSMGLTEQGVFPEINMAEVNFTHGMNINFSFSNSSPDKSRLVLTELGMPFAKPEERNN